MGNIERLINDELNLQDAFLKIISEYQLSGYLQEFAESISNNNMHFDNILSKYKIQDISEIKNETLDLILHFFNIILDDYILTSYEMTIANILKKKFKIVEGDFYNFKKKEIQDIILKQLIKIYRDDDKITKNEALHKVELQSLFDLGYDQFLEFANIEDKEALARNANIFELDTFLAPETENIKDNEYRIKHSMKLFILKCQNLIDQRLSKRCIYCGQKAGLFKKLHSACELVYINGKMEIIKNVKSAIINNSDLNLLENDSISIAKRSYIKNYEIIDLHVRGFDRAVDYFLEDGIISKDEEANIYDFMQHFNYDQKVLNKNDSISKVVKGSILRDIFEGIIPAQRVDVNEQIPILFQKNESIIWVFHHVSYFEHRTRTVYQGSSQGLSMKIAKGLYYRVSAFKGNPVRIEEMNFKTTGLGVVTTKHFYFSSSITSFKIPFSKIVAINPYEDGVGIQKDGVSSKPQVFKGIDGWFIFNVISFFNQK